MNEKYWEEMGEAMSFLGDVLIDANYTPAQVRRLAEIVRGMDENDEQKDQSA